MKDVVVLIPTLGRPHHIEPLLESLYATAPDAHPLFLTTESDVAARSAIAMAGERYVDVIKKDKGDYARKINLGYRISKEPLIFMGATDIKFHPGWLENAAQHIGGGVEVVGTNDLGNPRVIRGQHSTHTLVTRHYVKRYGTVDEPNKVLHEGYPHEYVDDEFIQTAKCRDAFAMALDSIVEHLHPTWGKGTWDNSYREVNNRLDQGYRHFCRRSKLWTQL